MKESLIVTILKLCGVTDTDSINHVVIDVTPSEFKVHIQQNSKTPDGKFIVSDQAVVQKLTEFKLVEVEDESETKPK